MLSWVFKHSEAQLASRLVLLVLADHAKDDGSSSWPSVATIASEARVNERTVQRCLRELADAGHITKTGESRTGTSVWTVHMGPGGRQSVTPASVHLTGGTAPPEPSLEQPSEDLAASRPRDQVWDVMVECFGAVADKTNAHARRNKAVADLKRLGAEPAAIVDARRAWREVFPGATATDIALATHFVQLHAHAQASRKVVVPIREVLDLPEISEDERQENLARLRKLGAGIGGDVA